MRRPPSALFPLPGGAEGRCRSRLASRALAALAVGSALLLAPAAPLAAQTIAVQVGDSARLQVAPGARVGIPLRVDLANAGSTLNLASLAGTLTWGSTRLTFDSIRVNAATGFTQTTNTTGAATGSVVLSYFGTTQLSSSGALATAWFTAAGTAGGTRVAFAPTEAGSEGGQGILGQLVTRALDVCVGASSARWGDVNDDGGVSIIDAQQIARSSVGLSVANAAAVAARGDVNADGTVSIIDAQQIARFSVGLSAAARINTLLGAAPTVATLALAPSAAQQLAVGGTLTLAATPRDAANADLTGCATVSFASSAASVATVSTSGVVTGVAAGTATITATSGTQNATVAVTVTAASGGTVAALELVEGDDLVMYPAVNTGAPVRVRARSALGAPVAGATITVSVSGNALIGAAGTFRPATGSGTANVTLTTDANGEAVFAMWGPLTAPATGTVSVAASGATTRTMTASTIPIRLAAHTCRPNVWTVQCWGDNSRGQLGNGTTTSSATPAHVNLSGVTLGTNSIVAQEGFGDHMCVTDNSRAAWCWGSNTAGQLGDSSLVSRSAPVRVKSSAQYVDLVMGGEHTCGLTTAGEVWCWGYNWAGQLGDGTVSNRRTAPVRALLPAGVVATALSAGTNHSCAGTATGTWYCWGLNASGQLGDGTITNRPIPTVVAGGPYAQVDGGEGHSCGRTSTGETSCWGNPANGALGNGALSGAIVATPTPVLGGHRFAYLYAGWARTCAMKADFSVWCWGRNTEGALGTGSTVSLAEPARTAFTGYALRMGGTNLTSAGQTTCALTNTTQQVFCWGANLNGQLGTGAPADQPALLPQLLPRAGASSGAGVPGAITPVAPLGVGAVAAGTSMPAGTFRARLRDAQGTPLAGQTITWDILEGPATFAAGGTSATSVTDAAGEAPSPPATAGGTPGVVAMRASIPGTSPTGATGLVRHVFTLMVQDAPATFEKLSGDSTWTGWLQLGTVRVPLRVRMRNGSGNPIVGAPVVFAVEAGAGSLTGGGTSVVIQTDANGVATLPADSWTPNATLGSVSVLTATNASGQALAFAAYRAGESDPSALTSCELNSAGAAFCWGSNTAGTVGNGSNTQANAPVAVSGGLTFAALADGVAAHKCGLVGTTAHCWGYNAAGQLGDGSQVSRNVPTPVAGGLAFARLAVGGVTTCGITTPGGQLYCWGWSGTAGFGQGAGETRRARVFPTPVLVATPAPFTKVVVADDAVCGLTASGAIWCRGAGAGGWNLDGTFDDRSTWTQAAGGPWKDASATYLGLCAIGPDDRAYCAGADQGLGALGTGTLVTARQSALSAVAGGTTFTSIHNYHFGACGRRSTGEVWCWGSNAFGQTGTGTTSAVLAPTRIPGVAFATFRPMAFRTNCGKVASGLLYCMGQNSNGQVGVGSTTVTAYSTPVAVSSWSDGPAAGVPASLQAAAATPGGALVSTNVSPAPAVIVRDRTGLPVTGVSVTFAITDGGGSGTGLTTTTDATGTATVGRWTMGPVPAVNRMVASVAGLPSVTFVVTTSPPAGSIAARTSAMQYGASFETNSRSPVAVVVRDAANAPIANFPVTYSIGTGGGTVGGGTVQTVLTDANGVAQGPTWVVPATAGTFTLLASAAGVTAPVTFTWSKNSQYGGQNSCRLRTDGQALCWGNNGLGQVGDNTTTDRAAPTLVAGSRAFASLAEGARSQHHCALTAAGAAWCWGYNAHGELGDGTQVNRSQPVAVAGGLTFRKLFKGLWSTCGITTANQLYCWGWTSRSRFGDGVYGDAQPTPRLVTTNGLVFDQVALAWEGTCGMTLAGNLHCWGNNPGEAVTPRDLPSTTPLPGLVFRQLSGGDRGYCGVTTSGGVRCWGDNANGQLGNGSTTFSTTPVTPTGLGAGVEEVRHASWTTACARGSAGEMWCWGSNQYGQVGDGTSGNGSALNRTGPVRIGAGLNFTGFHAVGMDLGFCSRVAGGGSFCWGNNPIGDGTQTPRAIPTMILWPEGTAGTARTMVTNLSAAIPNGTAGTAVTTPPAVVVRDFAGNPVAGVTVTFAVASGSGTITGATQVTNASGIATLGSLTYGAAGTTTVVTASATAALGLPQVVFAATSTP